MTRTRKNLLALAAILALYPAAAPADTTNIAIVGDPTPAGGTFSSVDISPVINSAGQVAFSGVTSLSNLGLMTRGDGINPLVLIARQGAPAPGGGMPRAPQGAARGSW